MARFKKGESGNPGGRSKKQREIEELAQLALQSGESNLAIDGLIEIATSEATENRDRIRALELLMAYAYGRPRQRQEISGPDGGDIAGRVVIYIPDNGRDPVK